jgi:hypothetical protein
MFCSIFPAEHSFARIGGVRSAAAIDAAQFFLVTWPLAFLGLNMFGPEEFWTRYQLFFFPACFVVFYLVGSGIGWIMGYDRRSDASESGKPPDTP